MNALETSEILATGLSECMDRLSANRLRARPISTYRLQLNSRFHFSDARELAPYLHALGISHIYSSPILKAREGSTHGYDIIDHDQLNPEIGTEDDFMAHTAELRRLGMGQILDIVPNHMGMGQGNNPWWMDVLENGRAAAHAHYFDIDWNPLKPELRNKLLLPILGNQYGEELENGHLTLQYDRGQFRIQYYDKVLPVDPQTIPLIFDLALFESGDHEENSEPTPEKQQLLRLLAEFRALPSHTLDSADAVGQRRERVPALIQQLDDHVRNSADAQQLLLNALEIINGMHGGRQSFDALHRLLESQVYRLAHWQVSAEEINYRRFFDVNDLIGLRMEDPRVFAATHRLIRKMLAEGGICGLRIDHCDGLLNPRQYLVRLQMLYAASQCIGAEPIPPLAENGIEVEVQRSFGMRNWASQQAPLYCVVEKILEPGEALPDEWPVDGASGYEFANLVNGIFIQKRNERAFSTLYQRFTGETSDVDTLIYLSKRLIMNTALSSELTVLGHILDDISTGDRHARDFTRRALHAAVRETIACFSVYRSYIDERGEITERDRGYINLATAWAKRRNTGTAAAIFDFVRDILLLKPRENEDHNVYRKKLHFTLKFQQLTGPVMAKGLEDTVCYVYNRFVALNEVGGSPKKFGHTLDEFHRANQTRREQWPYSMLCTSTHDTKRSEDVRARIDVLSEMPKRWSSQVMRWRRGNRARKRILSDGRTVPDANEEYLLYQTLVGAWPMTMRSNDERREFARRISEYMVKAAHEAKVNLSWINPNPEYVDALQTFIARLLLPSGRDRASLFLQQMADFLAPVQFFGALNSLSQTLLKITSPGIPDIYQGNELWDFSLVDPDNRRPVDFDLRRKALHCLEERSNGNLRQLCAELLENHTDGRVKMWVTMRALRFRRDHPELFRTGGYTPLPAQGDRSENICAFIRGLEEPAPAASSSRMALAAVPRFGYTMMNGQNAWPLGEDWGDSHLPLAQGAPEVFENVFTGEIVRADTWRRLPCREIFASFPVALLMAK